MHKAALYDYTCGISYVGGAMMAIIPLLLCLLSALVEVHSQTAPYITFMGAGLPNHSYVDITAVGSIAQDSVQCHTDLPTCCRAMDGPDRGIWFSPTGVRLTSSSPDMYRSITAQRTDLRRRSNSPPPGIYHCRIETVAVHSDPGTTGETAYVGLYASGGELELYWHACHHRLPLPLYM